MPRRRVCVSIMRRGWRLLLQPMQETLMILDLEFGCEIHLFYSLCGVGIYFSCEVKLVEKTRKNMPYAGVLSL